MKMELEKTSRQMDTIFSDITYCQEVVVSVPTPSVEDDSKDKGISEKDNSVQPSQAQSESTQQSPVVELPKEYSYVGGCLYYKIIETNSKDTETVVKDSETASQRIANGFPVAKTLKVSINPDGSKHEILSFCFIIDGKEEKDIFNYDVSELSDFNFDSYYKLIVNPTCVRAKFHLVRILKESIKSLTPDNKFHFSKLGWNQTPDGHVYVAGKTVICKEGILAPDTYEIDNKLKNIELEVDWSLQISMAVKKLLILFIKYPEAALIYIYALATSLKSLFIKAGVDSWFSVFLVGDSEVGKTSASCYLGDMFNCSKVKRCSVVGLDDSKSHIYDQSDYFRDAVLIVDDLNKSLSKETKRKKEYALGEAIQCVANGYSRSTTKKSTAFNSGLIATAEYALKNISTINRTLLLNLKHPIFPKKEFDTLSADTIFMSTIHYHFLVWAARNHDRIVDYMKNQKISLKNHRVSIHDRINDSLLTMVIAEYLFCSFCKPYLGDAHSIIDQVISIFQKCLEKHVLSQDNFIKRIQFESQEHDFAKVIFMLYSSGKLDIGRKNLVKHDAVEKKGQLIITTDKLHKLLLTVLKGTEFSSKSVCKQLGDRGLLNTDSSLEMKSTKKFNSQRALFIDLKRLENYYLENRSN